jgi:hypothetical protein
MFELPAQSVTITDRTCVDCGGACTVFAVANNVWDGLGLPLEDWICLGCFARRLNPENPPTNVGELRAEIVSQRRRFKLEVFNLYSDVLMPRNKPFGIGTIAGEPVEKMTAEQCGKCRRPSLL